MASNRARNPRKGKKGSSSVLEQSEQRQDNLLAAVDTIINPGTKLLLSSYVAPPAVRTRLKYNTRLTLTSTVGVRQVYLFRHNGCFDPDVTGIGAQPEGFDEWMAFYDRFRVVSSKMTVRGSSQGSTSATGSFWLVVVPSGSATPFAVMEDAEASPYAISRIFSQGGPPIKAVQMISTATLVGVAPTTILSDITYSGTNAADPGDPTYWHILVQSADATSTVITNLIVEIEFLVDFYDRNNSALSATVNARRLAREKAGTRGKTASVSGVY